MNPTSMSTEAERCLEWLNLVLAIICVVLTVFLWSTSPRPLSGDSPVVIGAVFFTLFALPVLLLTSSMLLFTNRQLGMLGFGALLVSVVALSHSSIGCV